MSGHKTFFPISLLFPVMLSLIEQPVQCIGGVLYGETRDVFIVSGHYEIIFYNLTTSASRGEMSPELVSTAADGLMPAND